MSNIDELGEKIAELIDSYEKEIQMVNGLLEDTGEFDEKSRVICETMLREKTMFLAVLKNL